MCQLRYLIFILVGEKGCFYVLERNYQEGDVIFYNSNDFGSPESITTTLFRTSFDKQVFHGLASFKFKTFFLAVWSLPQVQKYDKPNRISHKGQQSFPVGWDFL